MPKLIINRAGYLEGKPLNVQVYLNEGKIGAIENQDGEESFEVPIGSHLLHVEREGQRSNQVRLKVSEGQEVEVEMLSYFHTQRVLQIILAWVMCAFCFNQVVGFGLPIFLVLGLVVAYRVKTNRKKMTLRK